MRPIEFMARLAAIVAPPRSALLRYHGVLAANAPWRKSIVPLRDRPCAHVPSALAAPKTKTSAGPSVAAATKLELAGAAQPCATPPKPSGDPTLLGARAPQSTPTNATAARSWRPSTSYVPWAELLKRSFDFDILECTKCHARMRPVAVITRQDIVDKILVHLRLPLCPAALGRGSAIGYDVTGEPIGDWVVGVDPEPDERGPPSEAYCIDPPAPAE